MIPADEPVLLFDSTWIRASNVEPGVQLMSRRGNAVPVVGIWSQADWPIFRVTLSDGSWFRTSKGGAWVGFETLDTNHGGAKPGPRLPVKAIERVEPMHVNGITVAAVDSAGDETRGLIVVRNYVMVRADW